MMHIVGHIDMDAFFASVEERDKPYLKGFPVIIGADPQGGIGRGVVSTANYKARKLGIGSAVAISTAWKLCESSHKKGGKSCVFITPKMEKYQRASDAVFSIVREYVHTISQVSVDEAALDLSFCKTYASAKKIAQNIKKEVLHRTGLTCSIGIGENRMIAKIASNYKKPNGLMIVRQEETESFLQPLSIRSIPGVGKVTQDRLHTIGIVNIRDAQNCSWEELQESLGAEGLILWEKVHGIDERAVIAKKPINKSIGKHHTFEKDTHNLKEVTAAAKKQIEFILTEIKKQHFSAFRTVVLTIRFDTFETKTRSLTSTIAICSKRTFESRVIKLLLPFFEKTENPKGLAIRLVGVRVEKLI